MLNFTEQQTNEMSVAADALHSIAFYGESHARVGTLSFAAAETLVFSGNVNESANIFVGFLESQRIKIKKTVEFILNDKVYVALNLRTGAFTGNANEQCRCFFEAVFAKIQCSSTPYTVEEKYAMALNERVKNWLLTKGK